MTRSLCDDLLTNYQNAIELVEETISQLDQTQLSLTHPARLTSIRNTYGPNFNCG